MGSVSEGERVRGCLDMFIMFSGVSAG